MRYFSLIGFFVLIGCASAPPPSSTPTVDVGEEEGCQSPLGFIREGQTATGYLHSVESAGQSCQQGTLSCHDGSWSGPYIYASCVRLLSN